MCRLWMISLCFFMCLAQGSAQQLDKKKLEQLYQEAQTHFELQEYEEALAGYKEVYRQSQKAEMLFNIGQCYRSLKRYEEAMQSFKTFLTLYPDSPYRESILSLIDELVPLANVQKQPLEVSLPSTTPSTQITPASLSLASSSPASSFLPTTMQQEVPVESSRSWSRPWLYASASLGGSSVLSLAVAIVAQQQLLTLLDARSPETVDEILREDRRAKRFATLSSAAIAGALVSLGGAWWFGHRQEKTH